MNVTCSSGLGNGRDSVLGMRGIHKGAAALLLGGAGGIDACQRFLLARSVLPAGEPSFSPPLFLRLVSERAI